MVAGIALAQDNLFRHVETAKEIGGFSFRAPLYDYLEQLSPVKVEDGGNIEAKVKGNLDAFSVGTEVPERVHLIAEKWGISMALLWFSRDAGERLMGLLCQFLGAPNLQEGACFWDTGYFVVCYNVDNPEEPNIIICPKF